MTIFELKMILKELKRKKRLHKDLLKEQMPVPHVLKERITELEEKAERIKVSL